MKYRRKISLILSKKRKKKKIKRACKTAGQIDFAMTLEMPVTDGTIITVLQQREIYLVGVGKKKAKEQKMVMERKKKSRKCRGGKDESSGVYTLLR